MTFRILAASLFAAGSSYAVSLADFTVDTALNRYSGYASDLIKITANNGETDGTGLFGTGKDAQILGDGVKFWNGLRANTITNAGQNLYYGTTDHKALIAKSNVVFSGSQSTTTHVYDSAEIGGTFSWQNTAAVPLTQVFNNAQNGYANSYPAPLGPILELPATQLPGYNDPPGYAPSGTMPNVDMTNAIFVDPTLRQFRCMVAFNDANKCNGDTLRATDLSGNPNYFGDIIGYNQAHVLLGEGVYFFKNIRGNQPDVIAVQPHRQRTVIYLSGSYNPDATGNCFLGPSSAFDYPNNKGKTQVCTTVETATCSFGGTVMLVSKGPLVFPRDSPIWATVSVPKSNAFLSQQFSLFGQVFADTLLGAQDWKFTTGKYIPFNPIDPVVSVNPVNAFSVWEKTDATCTARMGKSCRDTTITVSMDHVNPFPVGIDYDVIAYPFGANLATADVDFVKVTSGHLTIPILSLSSTFTLSIFDDGLKEPAEQFQIVLRNLTGASFAGSNGKPDTSIKVLSTRATILDNDPTPTLQVSPISQTEGTGAGTKAFKFYVTLADSTTGTPLASSASGGADFTWSTIAGTAAAGTDFVAVSSKAVSWPAGKSSDTLTVQVYQDSSYESNETFQVSATPTAAGNVQILSSKAVSKATGTILNDDSAPTLSIANVSMAEGAAGTFTAKLSVRSAFPACFDWKTADGTAKALLDYKADSATNVCIAAGSLSTTFAVTTSQDAIYEGSETFKVNAAVRSGITLAGSVMSATGTITDDDARPRIWISDTTIQRPASGTTIMKFVVRLLDSATGKVAAPSGLATTYSWSTVPGSALADTDYVAASGNGSIAAGATTDTIRITIVGDARYHAPLSFSVVLASPTNVASAVSRLTGVGTILSAVGRPVLVASNSSISEGDAGRKSIGVVVSLHDSASGNPVTSRIALPFSWSSTSGMAKVGTDFVAMDGSGSVPAGSSQTTVVTDSVIGNLIHQNNRAFSIAVASSGSDLRPGSSTVTGTIQDDDPVPMVWVDSVSIRRDTVAGSKTPLWFHVRLLDPRTGMATTSGLPVSFVWRTLDGTAMAGVDYLAASGKVTIPVGGVVDSVSVTVLGDSRFSPANAFKVVLDSLSQASFRDSIGVGSISGGARKPQLVLVGGSVVRRPASGDSIGLPFGYYLVDPLTGARTTSRVAQSIRWSTFDSTAKVLNNDYKQVTDRAATLGASHLSDTLKVSVLGLGAYAPPRQLGARVGTVDTNWISGDLSKAVALGTIYDPFTVVANFVTRDTSLREDAGTLNVVVRLNKPSTLRSALPVVVDSSATTAKKNVNFRLLDSVATFVAGDTLDTLRFQLFHDTAYTGDLQVRLRLLPDAADTVGVVEPSTVTIVLREADAAPRLSFLDTLETVREADTTISVIIKLDRPSALPITGSIAAIGGSAKSGINYLLGSGGFVFPAMSTTATVSLGLLSDHRYGPNHDVVLGWGSVVDSANVGFDPVKKQERIVILESDAKPSIGFAQDTLVVQDVDGSADVGIELSSASDSVALAGLVYDASRSKASRIAITADSAYGVSIDTGAVSAKFHFTFGNDGKVGDDRFVRLVLRNPIGAVLGTDSVIIVRIRNTNRSPVVVITTPVDSSRLSDPHQRIEWTVGGVPQSPSDTTLSSGWNTITRCATDSAGNTGCHTHHVWGDFTPPTVHVFKITGPNTLNPAKDTTWWGDKARTRFGNDTIWYWVRDSMQNADNSWRVVVDTHSVAVSFKGDSLFPTQVKACDSVGNCGVDTGWIDLKQSLPKVAIQTPPDGSHVVAGTVPVVWNVTDAGKTSSKSDLQTVTIPGITPISRCFSDDVGNTGCDTNKVVVEPIHVVKSYYVDTDGDGRVDAAVVELDSRWMGSDYPSFDFRFGDSLRTGNTPNAKSPFYAGPSRGTVVVVGKDTFNVEAGPALTDSVGHPLMGVDGYPLTGALGDTAYGLDGKPLRDGTGHILYKVAANGKVDSTRFLVPIKPPFAFGMTGFDSAQQARMTSSWTETDSTGKKIPRNVVDTFAVGDKVAPVILKAEIHRVENYKDPDTLFVTPSEKLTLGSGRDWLQVGRCPAGMAKCAASELIWENVPDSLVTRAPDGRYWFLVQPESLSIRPNYQVRFRSDVSDSKGNGIDTSNLHWNTLISGPPRPDIVELVLPNRIPSIPSSEADHTSPGGILIRATKGKGGTSTMRWWEPGRGYLTSGDPSVRSICPVAEYCNGPSVYINRPVRLIVFIYDKAGTFVSHRTIDITQQDIDAMEPDQLDRLSVEIDWNHRTEQGQLVASGVYLWRIVSYLTVEGRTLPMMTNQLYKVGVKVEN